MSDRRTSGKTFFQPGVAKPLRLDARPAIRVLARTNRYQPIMTFPFLSEPENERAQSAERLLFGSQPGTATGRAPFSEILLYARIAQGISGRDVYVNAGAALVQAMVQPKLWAVARPVFHFQRSTKSCRAKATIICFLRRACALGLSSTGFHFFTSQ